MCTNVQSLHRHAARVYSKKFACLVPSNVLLCRNRRHRYCTCWRPFDSHVVPFPKQDNISIDQLYSLTRHIAKVRAALASKQPNAYFAKRLRIINGIYSRLLLHFLTGMLHTLQTRIRTLKRKYMCFTECATVLTKVLEGLRGPLAVRLRSFQNHAVLISKEIESSKTAYGRLWFLKCFNTYIGGFSLKIGRNATHLSKNAIIFAQGCCIHWGIVFFLQSHFTSSVCKITFPSCFVNKEHSAWIGACLECTFSKGYLSFTQCHTFCKRLLHWGMVSFMQNHFTSAVCKLFFLRHWSKTYYMNWCLFGMHIFQGTLAYVEVKSCRDVEFWRS